MDDSDSSEADRHRYIKDNDKKDITCRQAGYVLFVLLRINRRLI